MKDLLLAFSLVATASCGSASATSNEVQASAYAGSAFEIRSIDEADQLGNEVVVDSQNLADVQSSINEGEPTLLLTLSPLGQEAFARFTEANIGQRVAIILHGQVRSMPRIQAPITGGRLMVVLHETSTVEAERIASGIRSEIANNHPANGN